MHLAGSTSGSYSCYSVEILYCQCRIAFRHDNLTSSRQPGRSAVCTWWAHSSSEWQYSKIPLFPPQLFRFLPATKAYHCSGRSRYIWPASPTCKIELYGNSNIVISLKFEDICSSSSLETANPRLSIKCRLQWQMDYSRVLPPIGSERPACRAQRNCMSRKLAMKFVATPPPPLRSVL